MAFFHPLFSVQQQQPLLANEFQEQNSNYIRQRLLQSEVSFQQYQTTTYVDRENRDAMNFLRRELMMNMTIMVLTCVVVAYTRS